MAVEEISVLTFVEIFLRGKTRFMDPMCFEEVIKQKMTSRD